MKNSSITRNSYCFAMILFITALLTSHPVAAATYYVATTGNDGNPGTQAQPWLTLQKAANTVVAGDTVLIRGGTYTQATINFVHSGTAGNLITWKPEPATGTVTIKHNSVVAPCNSSTTIALFGISYNHIEGFTIGPSLTDRAILISGTNNPDHIGTVSDARGNEIVNNTFTNIANDGSTCGGNFYPGAVTLGDASGNLIQGNTFNQNYGQNIDDEGGYQNSIISNTITNLRPSAYNLLSGIWVASNDFTWSPGSTVRKAGYDTITDNIIDGLVSSTEASGIHCDAGGHNLTIRRNTVRNMGSVNDSAGIYMESRCMNNLIANNVVTNSNRGVLLSNPSIGASNYNTIVNNTLYGNQYGVFIKNGGNNLIANNIGAENTSSQVIVSQLSVAIGSNTFKNNLWWRSTTNNVAMWNCADAVCDAGPANQTLAAFNTSSGQTASLSVNPLFVSSSDFHLQAGSPAIDTGTASTNSATISYAPVFAGSAPDMGAFETSGGAAGSSPIPSPPSNLSAK